MPPASSSSGDAGLASGALRPAPLFAFVVPCYNEEETLPRTLTTLSETLARLKAEGAVAPESFALYVDDGSRDGTWALVEARHAVDPSCRGISFAHNAGHQNAVWAGMDHARTLGCDCIVSLDADLQDDVAVVGEMLERYREGCAIVYGVRNDRSTDTRFKRCTAEGFYAFMRRIGVDLVPDHADYRLVSREVLEVLPRFTERDLFLRGLFPAIGFTTAKVYYKRQRRQAGTSKYPLSKMLSFAMRGMTSCSVAPLRLAGFLSLVCVLAALATAVYALWGYFSGATVPGWTSLMVIVLLLGAMQLFCLSLVGEYVAKIFVEVRRRPRYIVEKEI